MIGTAAAIGLGIAGVGTALGASSQNKAANKAADTSLAVAQQNNALAQQIYGQNQAALSPFQTRGNAAGDALNAMLGLSQPQQPQVQSYYSGANPAAAPMPGAISWQQAQGYNAQNPAQFRMQALDAYPLQEFAGAAPPMQQTGIAGPLPQSQAGDPFKQYIANSDYAFQFGEGANRVNSGYAGAGTLQSGAAMKSLEDYRQNLQSGYRGEFMNALANQQGVGLGAASAQAGVGQNYVNTISANNNNAGTAAANAALAKGANNPFANALGLLGGGLFGMAR